MYKVKAIRARWRYTVIISLFGKKIMAIYNQDGLVALTLYTLRNHQRFQALSGSKRYAYIPVNTTNHITPNHPPVQKPADELNF